MYMCACAHCSRGMSCTCALFEGVFALILRLWRQFFVSVLFLMINCVITSLNCLWKSGAAANFDHVVTKFIINKDRHKKIGVNLFFTIAKPPKWVNEVKRHSEKPYTRILFKLTRTLAIAFLAFWLATYINDVDAAQKCNFAFLQSFLDYSNLCDWESVC